MKLFNGSAFTRISKVVTLLVSGFLCFKVALYGISSGLVAFFIWGHPSYDFDLRLPSADGRYDLVVLREDDAAIADFFYWVYVFPHALTPVQTPKGERILMTGIWRDKKYLTYSGYATPELRWTSTHEIEIDLNDAYDQVDEFHPIPSMDTTDGDWRTAILVSLVFNKEDTQDAMP
jgi:hypothetical protein